MESIIAQTISDALVCGYTTYVRYSDEKGNHCAKFSISSYPHSVINNLMKVIDKEIDSVEYSQSGDAIRCIITCK